MDELTQILCPDCDAPMAWQGFQCTARDVWYCCHCRLVCVVDPCGTVTRDPERTADARRKWEETTNPDTGKGTGDLAALDADYESPPLKVSWTVTPWKDQRTIMGVGNLAKPMMRRVIVHVTAKDGTASVLRNAGVQQYGGFAVQTAVFVEEHASDKARHRATREAENAVKARLMAELERVCSEVQSHA